MVFGPPGHPGLHAVRYVVEEHQQGQDHVMGCGVTENLVLETALKLKIVMINVAVSISIFSS